MAPHLPTMIAPGGKVAALGDSAHDMTPFLGQGTQKPPSPLYLPELTPPAGAAMAVEDAIVLGEISSVIQDPADVPPALKILDAVRVPRTSAIKRQAVRNVELWHLHDGAEQRERDAGAGAEVDGGDVKASPYIWSDPSGMQWLFGYDLEAVFRGLKKGVESGGGA